MATIGYARRSRERDNGSYSLDDQEVKIRRWADYREVGLTDLLREDDVSGATPPDERPMLGSALRGMKRSDVLVVAKFDRLSRSLHDFAGLIERSKREGWALVCLDPELDLTTATGRAFAGMLGVFAQFEREQLIERLQGAKRAKARAGGYVGGSRLHRRYGFRLVEGSDGKREYEPVPEEQEVIIEVCRMRDAGKKLREIAADLKERKVPSPTGGEWHPSMLHRIVNRARA
jgi:DNA invertase Pin-like site-specific DNA recombinase